MGARPTNLEARSIRTMARTADFSASRPVTRPWSLRALCLGVRLEALPDVVGSCDRGSIVHESIRGKQSKRARDGKAVAPTARPVPAVRVLGKPPQHGHRRGQSAIQPGNSCPSLGKRRTQSGSGGRCSHRLWTSPTRDGAHILPHYQL